MIKIQLHEFSNTNELSVRELKNILKDWPEVDVITGDLCMVKVYNYFLPSNLEPINIKTDSDGNVSADIHIGIY